MIHYIRYQWVSNDPRLLAHCSQLATLFVNSTYRRVPNGDFAGAFAVLLTSFWVLGGFNGANLAIPTNRNLYIGKSRRNLAYTPELLKCISWLVKEGYLTKVRGVSIQSNKAGYKLRYNPSVYGVAEDLLPFPLPLDSISRNPLLGYVELRETFTAGEGNKTRKEKRAIPIPTSLNPRHKQVLETTNTLLNAYDQLMTKTKVTLGESSIPSHQTTLTRIFSRGSIKLGGRYYSPIQNLKSTARPYLRLNDEPTIEIDFSAIHPTMLYQLEYGSCPSADPYIINGWERDTVKVAFNIMLNSKGNEVGGSASRAIQNETGLSRKEAKRLEEKILYVHEPIEKYFNSDSGLALQRLDSEVMTNILQYFVYELKRPIIPIHDSAIVSVRDTESLRLAMESAYNEVIAKELNDSVENINGIEGIKANKSLGFTEPLNALIEQSLNGTLDTYDDDYWKGILDDNKALKCPAELFSTSIVIDDYS